MKPPKNVLDTFSGIGGFSLGLHRAGVYPKWIGFSDIDIHANKVFKRRFKDADELGSITDISYESLKGKGIDLITGGFPCQSFSIAGKRRGFEDTRGTLFFEIARLCKEYIDRGSPISCLLLENVKGLVNHDGGRTLAVILRTLRELGYLVEWQVVNTRWWLPQNRERIYILARYNGNPSGRKVLPIYPPSRETTERSKEVTIADWRSDEGLRIRKNGISPALTRATPPYIIKAQILDDYNNKIKDDVCGTLTQHCSRKAPKNGMKVIETRIKAHSLYPRSSTTGKGGTGHLSKEDGTSYCLDTGNCQAVEVGTRIRKLTPIECARLQGFPDDWNDCQSDSQRYKQYGNAITVNVAESIFNKLYEEK